MILTTIYIEYEMVSDLCFIVYKKNQLSEEIQ